MSVSSSHSPDERLKKIRQSIDRVDQRLLEILNERAALSKEVGEIKAQDQSPVFKSVRERDLLDRLSRINPGPLPEEHLRAIWREILSSSRALQRPQNVAYLGPEGTFSYFAGLEYLGHSASFHPCRDIGRIFEEVSNGSCDLGIVPLENSLQGTVGVSFDRFLKHDVIIEAELYSRISHALLSHASSLAAVKRVYSHPQPLAQCGAWLRTHLPASELIPVESTAAAAHMAANDPEGAAIGHVRLANMEGLEILARHIEDEPGNWTRFVVIARKERGKSMPVPAPGGKSGADKTSLLFTLPDKPGSLATVLEFLAHNKINMRKLESRPIGGRPWRYAFFADVESDLKNSAYNALLAELAQYCTSFRILGSYPAGPQLDRTIEEERERDE